MEGMELMGYRRDSFPIRSHLVLVSFNIRIFTYTAQLSLLAAKCSSIEGGVLQLSLHFLWKSMQL